MELISQTPGRNHYATELHFNSENRDLNENVEGKTTNCKYKENP